MMRETLAAGGVPCSHCGGPTIPPDPRLGEEGYYCESCGVAWRDTLPA